MNRAMMMELIKRREDLVAKITSERSVIAQNGGSIRPLVDWAGKINDVVHFLRSRPLYFILPAAVMTAARPRRFLGMAVSVMGLWRLARKWKRNPSSSRLNSG